ncbi:MAG: SynChlorMet cassette protein ScmC [Syntrophales bacterium LBB04]|nr:SynChlorMet cassette protein ScmC [Syntrophales bacterium LBB04]
MDFLARVAGLTSAPPGWDMVRRLLVVTDLASTDSSPYVREADVVCSLEPAETLQRFYRRRGRTGQLTEEQRLWRKLTRLSSCIARETQPNGGALLHSGLALTPPEWSGSAILVAGRSGVGKSTTIRRLPPPWRALSDDTALVVRDQTGAYRAHPWPTWSRFFGPEKGDGGDTWDVQQSVPLKAVFVLEQGEADRIEPLGPGKAVALLAELARQTSTHFLHGMPLQEISAFNRRGFENLCALVQAVPAYLLHVSLEGAFWEEIARTIRQPLGEIHGSH